MTPSRSRSPRRPHVVPASLLAASAAAALALTVPSPCQARQPRPPARSVDWRPVENLAEGYRLKLREGIFDAESEAILKTALGLLNGEDFRDALERHRKRLAVLLFGDTIPNEQVWDQAAMTGVKFLVAAARNPAVDMAVRINAMLMAGEIRTKAERYPVEAATTLAEAAQDADLPPAVRIAALAGLTRHLEAVRKSGPKESVAAVTAAAGPALVSIATAGLEGGIAEEWLASRALAALGLFTPALPPGANGTAARLAVDGNRSLDLRVRAARLLGTATKPASDFNAQVVANAITPLAIAALRADESRIEDRLLRQQLTASPAAPAGPAPPPDSPLLGALEGQRTAWRLATLADSLCSADGKSGLVVACGASDTEAAAMKERAKQLRDAADKIAATPGAAAVRAALATLAPSAATPVQAVQPEVPVVPTTPVEESPFASPSAAPRR